MASGVWSPYHPAMTQEELNARWSLIVMGQQVEDWAGADHGDIHSLTRLSTAQLWARRIGGAWVELPGMRKD